MRMLKLLVLVLLMLVGAIIGFQNSGQYATVDLLAWHLENYSLPILLFGATAVGILIAALVAITNEVALRQTIWRQKKEIRSLSTELTALRNLPLAQTELSVEPPEEARAGG
jgi:uncharacterized integral membrane protein